ncbi:MAG: FAD-dependent oxidoreductase [Acidimicrobiia bacterium]|nr:MAG: FAD-dependent oxidoreductase [Acidimicrobiia bacterium]
MDRLPVSAQVVIVGGGIVGCSTAYHLAQLGWRDIVLLERSKLTSGSTFHAAGLVGQLRTNANITQLLKYSVELYDRLEDTTGLATGWKQNGGLRLACSESRMIELKRQATTAHSFGLEMEMLSPREAQALWPLMDVADVLGAAFLPTDGQANPADIAQSLAKGARDSGVRIVEDCNVTGISTRNGRVTGVATEEGGIETEIVVNCAGQWARELGSMASVNVPLVSVEHQYVITEPVHGITRDLPTLRDPDRLTYFKEEVGGLVMGGYEHNPKPWAVGGIPSGFNYKLLEPDYEHFEQHMEHAFARVPSMESAGIKELVNGPESFTPDGNFILGEAPEVRGFYVGAGFNAFGIAAGGGAGKALAEWIVSGEQPMDLWAVDIRRFGPPHQDENWVRNRTLESYGKHYAMAWPHEEDESGRPLRVSPLYETLGNAGAVFGEKLGWERPNWFAHPGQPRRDVYSYGRQNWFDRVGEEHQAARERVALFDQSSFAKFMVSGPDAVTALSWICSNNIDKPVGCITYTQMLNQGGGIEADLTVTRIDDDEFYIVTGTGFATHDLSWIERNIPEHLRTTLAEVTDSYATLALMGPMSRDLLSHATDADLSNDQFPFATSQEIDIGGVTIRAMRVTYVGELGWELHIPTESAAHVYRRLSEAGQPFGLANAGYRAIESLRLEKGYRAWGKDIGPDFTPYEAGLGWAVKMASDIPFLGRERLLSQQGAPLTRRLACFTVDDPDVVLLGRESIYRNDEPVGWLTSGGWGYTVGTNIGYGYVRDEHGISDSELFEAEYSLEVASERVACKIHKEALYDPQMERVRS